MANATDPALDPAPAYAPFPPCPANASASASSSSSSSAWSAAAPCRDRSDARALFAAGAGLGFAVLVWAAALAARERRCPPPPPRRRGQGRRHTGPGPGPGQRRRRARAMFLLHTVVESSAQVVLLGLFALDRGAHGAPIPFLLLTGLLGWAVMGGTLWVIALWLFALPAPLLARHRDMLAAVAMFLEHSLVLDVVFFVLMVVGAALLLPLVDLILGGSDRLTGEAELVDGAIALSIKALQVLIFVCVLPPATTIPSVAATLLSMLEATSRRASMGGTQRFADASPGVGADRQGGGGGGGCCTALGSLLCGCLCPPPPPPPQPPPPSQQQQTAARTFEAQERARRTKVTLKLRVSAWVTITISVCALAGTTGILVWPALYYNPHMSYVGLCVSASLWQCFVMLMFFCPCGNCRTAGRRGRAETARVEAATAADEEDARRRDQDAKAAAAAAAVGDGGGPLEGGGTAATAAAAAAGRRPSLLEHSTTLEEEISTLRRGSHIQYGHDYE